MLANMSIFVCLIYSLLHLTPLSRLIKYIHVYTEIIYTHRDQNAWQTFSIARIEM